MEELSEPLIRVISLKYADFFLQNPALRQLTEGGAAARAVAGWVSAGLCG